MTEVKLPQIAEGVEKAKGHYFKFFRQQVLELMVMEIQL